MTTTATATRIPFTQPRPCTTGQVDLIAQLVTERHIDPTLGAMITRARKRVMEGTLSFADASTLITTLTAAPRNAVRTPATRKPAPEGMHILDGRMYRVVKGRGGFPYAQTVTVGTRTDGTTSVTFTATRGVMYRLSEATRMSAEQAAEFGARYDVCCNCGHDLSDPRSTSRGYGPKCAARNGWPWGDIVTAA